MGDYLAFPASPAPTSFPPFPHDRAASPSPSAAAFQAGSSTSNRHAHAPDHAHTRSSHTPYHTRLCHCHRPPQPRSNKIVIYPLPNDVPPNQLRDLLQSRIGPVVLMNMMMVGSQDIAAEVEFLRNDGWRAYRECRWLIKWG